MKKTYSLSESKKVKILAKDIIMDLQSNLLKFINSQDIKDLKKVNQNYQELKALNLTVINPLTGEISIPILKNGTKKDHYWSLIEIDK